MMYFQEMKKFEKDGFEIIVDRTYEDCDPGDYFDDTVEDIEEIRRKIDRCEYTWFCLRVRALFEGHQLGCAYLGGCLYENPDEVLTDGVADEFVEEALYEAKENAKKLLESLTKLKETL
jgi:hypothetical protein